MCHVISRRVNCGVIMRIGTGREEWRGREGGVEGGVEGGGRSGGGGVEGEGERSGGRSGGGKEGMRRMERDNGKL